MKKDSYVFRTRKTPDGDYTWHVFKNGRCNEIQADDQHAYTRAEAVKQARAFIAKDKKEAAGMIK